MRNLVIVGSGPAGYTAAIYAARAQLNPLIYEGSVTAGGALMNTTEVENFPGFAEGIMGPDLMDAMRKQALRFEAELITDDIVEMDLKSKVKVLIDGSGRKIEAKAVVLAKQMKNVYRAVEFHGVQLAMDFSSVTKILQSWVVEIQRWRKQTF